MAEVADEDSGSASSFDWQGLLETAVSTAGKVVAAKNTPTPPQNILTPAASTPAVAAANNTDLGLSNSKAFSVAPWMIYAGLGLVGLVLVGSLVVSRRN